MDLDGWVEAVPLGLGYAFRLGSRARCWRRSAQTWPAAALARAGGRRVLELALSVPRDPDLPVEAFLGSFSSQEWAALERAACSGGSAEGERVVGPGASRWVSGP